MKRAPLTHRHNLRVSFGDCDPAGIVFYPNIFAWFDRSFHDWLRSFGGHAALCDRLDAMGIGLMDVSARFRRPMGDGDEITVSLTVDAWQDRSLTLAYEIHRAGVLAVAGRETRGLFVRSETGMIAAEIGDLRKIMEDNGDRPEGHGKG